MESNSVYAGFDVGRYFWYFIPSDVFRISHGSDERFAAGAWYGADQLVKNERNGVFRIAAAGMLAVDGGKYVVFPLRLKGDRYESL